MQIPAQSVHQTHPTTHTHIAFVIAMAGGNRLNIRICRVVRGRLSETGDDGLGGRIARVVRWDGG